MFGNFWEVEDHRALNATVRAQILARFGVTLDVTHTYVALISLSEASPSGVECMVTFPFSFVLANFQSPNRPDLLEDAIHAECNTRLRAIKQARPFADIAKRRHWL